jgi:L-ascorbate metabolism protein UlaG (beta-lactamase superfamily)
MTVCVKWLGHVSFQIRAPDKVIYIDLKKYGKIVETSEKADSILVTHNHGDHSVRLKSRSFARKTLS